MNHRSLASLGALVAVIVVVSLAPVPVAGQAQTAAATTAEADTWTLPRTAWGDPDLQGVWSYATLTPLQRPAEWAGREFFTPEEVAARNARARADRPDRPGETGTYNALWVDRGEVLPDRRTSLIVDPPDGRLPLTPEARQRIAAKQQYRRAHPADSWLDLHPWVWCITYHGVPPVSSGYNNTYQILQTPDYVAILVEMIHDVRIIPLDGRPRLDDNIRQWNGDSRGHWEGDTLVVETTNYSDETELRFPSSRNTRAVERFRRIDEHSIDYQFTIDDPTVYTEPWTAVRPMPRLPDYRIYEYACHEENYAMTNILRGARAQEKAAAEAAKTGSR